MRTFTKAGISLGLILVVALSALALKGLGEAPEGSGAFEALRVALDPGAEYAVLHVQGMT